MHSSRDEKEGLAARASFLDERLGGAVLASEEQQSDTKASKRFEHWVATCGGEELFAKRLALDSVDEDQARRVLGPLRWPSGAPLPKWIAAVEDVLRRLPETCFDLSASLPAGVLQSEKPIPFEHALLPWLSLARNQLEVRCTSLSPEATSDGIRALLVQLSRLSSAVLLNRFTAFRSKDNPLALLLGYLPWSDGRGMYEAFVDGLLTGEWKDVLHSYPVLARLMAVTVDHWVSSTSELALRLEADRAEIRNQFAEGRNPGPIKSLTMHLSDPHSGGRTVVALRFTSGLRLVYKPRSLDIDLAWSHLLSWLNERGLPFEIEAPRVLNRGTHGWMEFIEPGSLNSEDEARQYYVRAGELLCLLYMLGGNDFHRENLIARRAHPVLVDLETIMLPRVRPFRIEEEGLNADTLAQEIMEDSVLRTGLLPFWIPSGPEKTLRDFGGLSGGDDKILETPARLWHEVNTDRMHLAPGSVREQPSQNSPHFAGRRISVTRYHEDVLEGFASTYDLTLASQGDLSRSNSPLRDFERLSFRFLPRQTQVYSDVQERLTSPSYLVDGAAFSIEIEGLARAFLLNAPDDRLPALWPMFRAERRALEQGDIPIFFAKANDLGLWAEGRPIVPEYFRQNCTARSNMILERMGSEDRRQQLNLTGAALRMRYAGAHQTASAIEPVDSTGDTNEVTPVLCEELLNEALRIGIEIKDSAIRGEGEEVTWITRSVDISTGRYSAGPIGPSLYDGRCGIALFLAALARVTDRDDFAELAKASVSGLRKSLHGPSARRLIRQVSLGALSGLGGLIYTFQATSHFLDDATLQEDALHVAYEIGDGDIEGDTQLDLIAGVAGTILALLHCFNLSGDRSLLARAEMGGRHLLNRRIELSSGLRGWQTPIAERPLAGMGHGQAGIAYALLRLHAASGEKAFYDAAMEAMEYETGLFSDRHKNWPDLRNNSRIEQNETVFMAGWCSGAPGIGLSRLGSIDVLDTPQVRTDIDNALELTRATNVRGADHLCCGNMSHIELLMEAGNRLKRPELHEEAVRKISRSVHRARQNGHYTFTGNEGGAVFEPSFFQGTSGIGYELLRLAYPEKLPCILLLEQTEDAQRL